MLNKNPQVLARGLLNLINSEMFSALHFIFSPGHSYICITTAYLIVLYCTCSPFSMHPYLFFNKNRTSITHVGLLFCKSVNSSLVLVDTYTKKPIGITISKEVLQFLMYTVKLPVSSSRSVLKDIAIKEITIYLISLAMLNENPQELVRRLLNFMAIKINEGDKIVSPDKSYVLTHDNLTKIMAIQTRFR